MDSDKQNGLSGRQKKYLRGLAHSLKAVVMVGQKGLTPAVIDSIEAALRAHELIKVRFIDIKDRLEKEALTTAMVSKTDSHIAGTVGHTVILYRPHPDWEKRKITLPRKTP